MVFLESIDHWSMGNLDFCLGISWNLFFLGGICFLDRCIPGGGLGHTRPETAGKTNVEEADLFFDSGKCGAPGGMLACKTNCRMIHPNLSIKHEGLYGLGILK